MEKVVHLILFIFAGALLVLIITHASGFATAVNAVGGQVTNDASLLAGYAPVKGAATQSATVNQGGFGNTLQA